MDFISIPSDFPPDNYKYSCDNNSKTSTMMPMPDPKPARTWKSLGPTDSISYEQQDADNQFMAASIESIAQGCKLLNERHWARALDIFVKVELALQEIVRKGRKVSFVVYVTVLNNIGGAFQSLGEHGMALDYLRGLLQTMNAYTMAGKDKPGKFNSLIRSISIARYYVYFLSLTLQLRMLEAAVVPANRSLEFFKKFCKEYRKSQLNLIYINMRMTEKLISQIEQFQSLLTTTSIWQLIENLRESALKVRRLASAPSSQCSKLRRYCVATLTKIPLMEMQIKQKRISEKNSTIRHYQNGLIQFPLCLFLIAKLHFQSNSKKNQNGLERIAVEDKIKLHTLWALYFACELCPYLTPFHKEIVEFYDENYGNREQQKAQAKIQVVESLQLPSLKDSDVWKDIKRHFMKLESQKQQRKTQELSSRNPEVQKVKSKQKSKEASRKRLHRLNSQQKFQSQKHLQQQKLKNKAKSPKKQIPAHENRSPQIKKQKPKQKKKIDPSLKKTTSQKNLSIDNYQIKIKSKSKKKGRQNKIKTQTKLQNFLNEYFPKQPQIKKVRSKERLTFRVDHRKQMVADYLDLQKKIRQSTRSLSNKKKALFRSVKKFDS